MTTSEGRNLGKYFVHGLALAVLFFIVGVAWAVILVVLVACGLFIGLAIGIVLFFVLMGYVNSFITESLWFPVRTGFLSCLGHGFLVFLAFLPLNVVILGIQASVTPNLLVSFVIFLVAAPVSGFLAMKVAEVWRIWPSPEPDLALPSETESAGPLEIPFDYSHK